MSQHYAYVGCYSEFKPGQLGWVGSLQPGEGILSFSFDTEDGTLTPIGEVMKQASPTWLELSPDGRFLVATHELSHHTDTPPGVGFVTSYEIQSDGSLAKICTQSTGGHGNTCATFDRTGRFLLVTRFWDGGFSVLPFDATTGMIGGIAELIDHVDSGPDAGRQSSSHPHGIHGDPNTDLVYVMDLGTDTVYQYVLEPATGTIEALSEVELASGSGPRGINFHPSMRVAYVNCELDGTVVVCTVDEKDGLEPVQTIQCYPEGFDGHGHPDNLSQAGFWGAEGALSADGAYYFYLCRVDQTVAVFAVDSDKGTLAHSGRHDLAAKSNARNLTLDPTGKYLLVASQDADCVECFRIDPGTGSLELVHTQPAPCAADVAVVRPPT